MNFKAFTLVEMLMALLIVSVILSASMPIITSHIKAQTVNQKNDGMPIGGIIVWGSEKPLPDNTWLEANGQAIPNGVEYEEIRSIYGNNLPDYRGVFLRGHGQRSGTVEWSDVSGNLRNSTTTYTSGAVGELQYDAIRRITGSIINKTEAYYEFFADYAKSQNGAVYLGNFGNYYGIDDSTSSGAKWSYDAFYFDSSRVVPYANENRPINVAVRYIVKVKK